VGGVKAAKLGFIYLSGMWIQGDSKEYGNELLPVGPNAPIKPAEAVAWKVEIENEILRQSEVLNAVILRAGLLFGGSGSFIGGLWWSEIQKAITNNDKTVELAGKPDSVLGLVHKDDIGQGFAKTVEKVHFNPLTPPTFTPPIPSIVDANSQAQIELIAALSYPVFSLVTCNESLTQINSSAAHFLASSAGASTVPTVTYRAPSNPIEEAMSCSSGISSDRARDLLGWVPRHTSLVGDMEVYVEAFNGAAA
jgi:nucleoside-diphosphate-sugar epimerase